MYIESNITPDKTLNRLASHFGVFGFLLRNITKPGHHFAARCYLSALDDSSYLAPGEIYPLLTALDVFFAERELSERGAQRPSGGKGSEVQKSLYVPVTRKVSLISRTF